MANQSDLTIGGIGGDPSGTHPFGNLNVNWAQSIDDNSIKYTANTIMSNPGASSADATDTYYSEELCVGTVSGGTYFTVGNTGDAQITACWQWFKPADGNNFNSGNDVVPGTAANLDAGTWIDIGTPIQNYVNAVISDTSGGTSEDLMQNGITRLRVKMIVTDAGSDGVAAGLVTTAVGVVNGAYMTTPFDKKANKNDTINNPVTIGGIGADPS